MLCAPTVERMPGGQNVVFRSNDGCDCVHLNAARVVVDTRYPAACFHASVKSHDQP
jgi:hypothetical protein